VRCGRTEGGAELKRGGAEGVDRVKHRKKQTEKSQKMTMMMVMMMEKKKVDRVYFESIVTT
jgi:hypothetical protein